MLLTRWNSMKLDETKVIPWSTWFTRCVEWQLTKGTWLALAGLSAANKLRRRCSARQRRKSTTDAPRRWPGVLYIAPASAPGSVRCGDASERREGNKRRPVPPGLMLRVHAAAVHWRSSAWRLVNNGPCDCASFIVPIAADKRSRFCEYQARLSSVQLVPFWN